MRVFCYYNLRKRCFSVKALSGAERGRVVAHARSVHLSNVEFRVSEKGRQKVLLERVKNVHAGAVGELTGLLHEGVVPDAEWHAKQLDFETTASAVSYNPYRQATFFRVQDGVAVTTASQCLLNGRSALVIA